MRKLLGNPHLIPISIRATFLVVAALSLFSSFVSGCTPNKEKQEELTLVTLHPGHFHAAVVQMKNYPGVCNEAYVYAPQGEDLQMHLNRIDGYNRREQNPTHWNEVVYTGDDFIQKMLADKRGNLLILAVNNKYRPNYILEGVRGGYHIFSDKPMAITSDDYLSLLEALEIAQDRGVMVLDMMSERFQATNALQKELTGLKDIFGAIKKGTPTEPAITIFNTHHFCKMVSGVANTRPEWYFDSDQQGVGIADVNTHLVDLVQWMVAGDHSIQMKDVAVLSARRWDTPLSLAQYQQVTKKEQFAPFLLKNVKENVLHVPSNGEITFVVNGVYARVATQWNFVAPEGTGDTQFATVMCEKGNIIIKQGVEQGYKPTLYIEFSSKSDSTDLNASKSETLLMEAVSALSQKYRGISLEKEGELFKVAIPDALFVGHETHITMVMDKLLDYYYGSGVPQWEKDQLKTKYFIITEATTISEQ